MAEGLDGFTAFVVGRYPRMLRAAVLLGVPRADAEDAVQDALARCYASWPRVRAAKDPDAYAYRILVNGVRRSARRRWRGEIPHAELPEPAGRTDAGAPDPAATVPVSQPVRAALARLGAAQRQAVVLRYVADLSEQQTAIVLGVPLGTVKSRTARALAHLADDATLAGLSPDRPSNHPPNLQEKP